MGMMCEFEGGGVGCKGGMAAAFWVLDKYFVLAGWAAAATLMGIEKCLGGTESLP